MPEYILETDEELDARENDMRELLLDLHEDPIDDFEPDDHADALEIGQRIYDTMRDTLIDAAAASLAFQDDKAETKKLKTALGRNPAHFITAIERFPELFGDDSSADIYEILGALALSKVKDDDTALALYEDWRGDGSKSLDDLKASIKEASPERERKPTPIQQVGDIVRRAVGFARSGKSDSLEPGIEWLASELCNIKEIEEVVNNGKAQQA